MWKLTFFPIYQILALKIRLAWIAASPAVSVAESPAVHFFSRTFAESYPLLEAPFLKSSHKDEYFRQDEAFLLREN
jgi:hypothetical protein